MNFQVALATTELDGTLLDADFRKADWLADKIVIWEKCRPSVMLANKADFEEDTALWLNQVFKWPESESDYA